MIIVLLGLAGSGKSLQGQIIAEKYGWKWLSVGQVLRDQNDPRINEDLKTGELFDDEFVTGIMHDEVAKIEQAGFGIVLDGYPRDEVQARRMIELGDMGKVDGVIVLEVSENELWERIKLRGRTDDTEDAIKRRWEIFEQNIYSILPLLEAENVKITTVDGVGEIEEVTSRIEKLLEDWGLVGEQEGSDGLEKDGLERSYGE